METTSSNHNAGVCAPSSAPTTVPWKWFLSNIILFSHSGFQGTPFIVCSLESWSVLGVPCASVFRSFSEFFGCAVEPRRSLAVPFQWFERS